MRTTALSHGLLITTLASLSLNLTIFEYKSYSLAKETLPFYPHYEWLVAEGRSDKGYKGGKVQPNNLGFSHSAGDTSAG